MAVERFEEWRPGVATRGGKKGPLGTILKQVGAHNTRKTRIRLRTAALGFMLARHLEETILFGSLGDSDGMADDLSFDEFCVLFVSPTGSGNGLDYLTDELYGSWMKTIRSKFSVRFRKRTLPTLVLLLVPVVFPFVLLQIMYEDARVGSCRSFALPGFGFFISMAVLLVFSSVAFITVWGEQLFGRCCRCCRTASHLQDLRELVRYTFGESHRSVKGRGRGDDDDDDDHDPELAKSCCSRVSEAPFALLRALIPGPRMLAALFILSLGLVTLAFVPNLLQFYIGPIPASSSERYDLFSSDPSWYGLSGPLTKCPRPVNRTALVEFGGICDWREAVSASCDRLTVFQLGNVMDGLVVWGAMVAVVAAVTVGVCLQSVERSERGKDALVMARRYLEVFPVELENVEAYGNARAVFDTFLDPVLQELELADLNEVGKELDAELESYVALKQNLERMAQEESGRFKAVLERQMASAQSRLVSLLVQDVKGLADTGHADDEAAGMRFAADVRARLASRVSTGVSAGVVHLEGIQQELVSRVSAKVGGVSKAFARGMRGDLRGGDVRMLVDAMSADVVKVAATKGRLLWYSALVLVYFGLVQFLRTHRPFLKEYSEVIPLELSIASIAIQTFCAFVAVLLVARADSSMYALVSRAQHAIQTLSMLVAKRGDGAERLPFMSLANPRNLSAFRALQRVVIDSIQCSLRRVEVTVAFLVLLGLVFSLSSIYYVYAERRGLDQIVVLFSIFYLLATLPLLLRNLFAVVDCNAALDRLQSAYGEELTSVPAALAELEAKKEQLDGVMARLAQVQAQGEDEESVVYALRVIATQRLLPQSWVTRLQSVLVSSGPGAVCSLLEQARSSRLGAKLRELAASERVLTFFASKDSDHTLRLFGVPVTNTLVTTLLSYLITALGAIVVKAMEQTPSLSGVESASFEGQ